MPLAAAAAAGVVVVVLAVLGAIDNDDADRRPQPVGTVPAPRMEVVATDVERGLRFGLDGRLLTVQMLPDILDASYVTVSGAQISATCGKKSRPPGDPRGETTLTRRWPPDQTLMIYRFPREVSSLFRLEDQSGGTVASVRFPGVPPGAREQITETANGWAGCSPPALSSATPTGPGRLRTGEVPTGRGDAHRGLQAVHAAVGSGVPRRDGPENRHQRRPSGHKFTSPDDREVQLRRTATGEWLIDRLGPLGGVASRGLLPCMHRRASCR